MARKRAPNISQHYPDIKKRILAGENIAAIEREYGVQPHTVRTAAQRGGWVREREKIKDKELSKASNKYSKVLEKKWDREIKLLSEVHDQISGVLEAAKASGLKPRLKDVGDLKSLADAIKSLITTQKLLIGEATDITESRSINIHAQIVQAIEQDGETFGDGPETQG